MTSLDEQETTVTVPRIGEFAYVWTNDRRVARRLRKRAEATQVDGDERGGNFVIPADLYDPISGFRRRPTLTDEQRAAAAARMKARHAARATEEEA